MKSMNDVKTAMGALYEEVRTKKTDLKTASELANIAGKYLKAEQLQLAREMFVASKGMPMTMIPGAVIEQAAIGQSRGAAAKKLSRPKKLN